MISFFFPALSLILVSLLLLLALKAAFKEILPSNSNIVKAISVFLVLCACIYAGMIGGHYLSRPHRYGSVTSFQYAALLYLFGFFVRI